MDLEKNLWISITVKNLEELEEVSRNDKPKVSKKRKWKKDVIIIDLGDRYISKDVVLKIWNEFLKFTTDSSWKIQIKKKKLVEKIDKYGVQIIW
jgi:predicted PilT family ATPase